VEEGEWVYCNGYVKGVWKGDWWYGDWESEEGEN
jgi:hypothetical protein